MLAIRGLILIAMWVKKQCIPHRSWAPCLDKMTSTIGYLVARATKVFCGSLRS